MNVPPDIQALEGGLIVSCQAEGDDPFNRPEYVSLFAMAAEMGGAAGIRARGAENIVAIREEVELPIIGLTKSEYPDGSVLITPDVDDVNSIIGAGAQIVALDVTHRTRPNGQSGPEFLKKLKKEFTIPMMADVSSLEEGQSAAEAGADMVAPTLFGYTPQTSSTPTTGPHWNLLKDLTASLPCPVIMEGGIWTPGQARKALDLGAFAVVVGTAITRPRVVTRAFVEAMRNG